MSDGKERLLSEINLELSDRLDYETLQLVNNIILLKMEDYEISEKHRELAIIDTESIKLLKKFLATKKIEGRSEKTIDRYAYIIKRFIDDIEMPVIDVDVYTLRLYLAKLSMDGCKDSTINGIRAIFCSFFGWLHDEGFLEKNPASNLGTIKCKKEIRKPYSKIELELLKNACPTLRDRAIIEFLLSTGCRIEEVMNLNISDIDFIKQECMVLGKGNKERVVFLNDVCAMHLKNYLDSREDSNEALFIGKGAVRLRPGGVRAMMKRLENITGVEDVHPHRFRRTLATSLIDKGMSIQDVASILGHSNINTTTMYIYTDKTNVRNTYDRIGA